jgi:hypothetical protein
MESKEFRIGNLLDYNGKIVKVTTLAIDANCNQIIMASNESFLWNVSKLDGIKPIPLTSELLLKFGFEKTGSFYRHKKSHLVQILVHNEGIDVCVFSFHLSHIKTVDQLQNLYFTLTGEELVYSS